MSSTPPDPRTYLWDARRAAEQVAAFVQGRTIDEYRADVMLRSAVERQFEIVGEALNSLRRVAPDVAAQITDLPRIVAFRNILAHGYARVDDNLVWAVATERVDPLIKALTELLDGE
jgi:uncharacterized protein with HEPN domain